MGYKARGKKRPGRACQHCDRFTIGGAAHSCAADHTTYDKTSLDRRNALEDFAASTRTIILASHQTHQRS